MVKCSRDYIANGHNYHCPPGLYYKEEEIPELKKTLENINLLENKVIQK